MGAHARLIITEVTESVGKDRSTIKTWLHKQGKYPHAAKDAGGLQEWMIPVGDIVAGDISSEEVLDVQRVSGHRDHHS